MSDDRSNVIPLRVAPADLDSAWEAYDAALQRMHRLYREDEPDADVRRAAVEAAVRAQREFSSLYGRLPTASVV